VRGASRLLRAVEAIHSPICLRGDTLQVAVQGFDHRIAARHQMGVAALARRSKVDAEQFAAHPMAYAPDIMAGFMSIWALGDIRPARRSQPCRDSAAHPCGQRRRLADGRDVEGLAARVRARIPLGGLHGHGPD
jgi:hypothetical protein